MDSTQTHEFTIQDLFMTDESVQSEYQNIAPKGVHFGHLKLLISDLIALVYFWNPVIFPNPIMVVAGGAPGNHYVSILRLFPTMDLHIYDPNPTLFDRWYGKKYREEFAGRLFTYNEFFTDAIAKLWSDEKYKKRGLIFTSDIRSADYEKSSPEVFYNSIVEDHRNQEMWVRMIDPHFAVLKFKVPIERKSAGREEEYNTPFRGMDGYVIRGVWAQHRSTECRLIPFKDKDGKYVDRVWDGIQFRDRNLFYSYFRRVPNAYRNIFTDDQSELIQGDLTNDYDSAARKSVV